MHQTVSGQLGWGDEALSALRTLVAIGGALVDLPQINSSRVQQVTSKTILTKFVEMVSELKVHTEG